MAQGWNGLGNPRAEMGASDSEAGEGPLSHLSLKGPCIWGW